jgi:hypothetical protein
VHLTSLHRPSVWRARKESASGASQEPGNANDGLQLVTADGARRQTGTMSHFPAGQEDEEASLPEQLAWLEEELGVLAGARKAHKASATAVPVNSGSKGGTPTATGGSAGRRHGSLSSSIQQQQQEQEEGHQHIIVNRRGQQVAISRQLLELWQAGLAPGLDELLDRGMPSTRASPRRKGRRHHTPASSSVLELP